MKKYNLFLFSISVFLTGCTTKTQLSYEPVIEKYKTNNTTVLVSPIEDVRLVKQEIGVKKNALGMPIIKIVTDDNVSEWVTNALKLEMNNAGYLLADSDQNAEYEIKGKLIKAYATTYFTYQGKMSVRISVCKGDGAVFDKVYHTKQNAGINWFATNESCVKALELNLQEVIRQFISDLNNSLLTSEVKTS